METCPHAHRRSKAHLERLTRICTLIAANPGIQKRELCILYYPESKYQTTDRAKRMTSMLQTLCAENRITHQDHHYFIAEA
jgi:hypothetical protein